MNPVPVLYLSTKTKFHSRDMLKEHGVFEDYCESYEEGHGIPKRSFEEAEAEVVVKAQGNNASPVSSTSSDSGFVDGNQDEPKMKCPLKSRHKIKIVR